MINNFIYVGESLNYVGVSLKYGEYLEITRGELRNISSRNSKGMEMSILYLFVCVKLKFHTHKYLTLFYIRLYINAL